MSQSAVNRIRIPLTLLILVIGSGCGSNADRPAIVSQTDAPDTATPLHGTSTPDRKPRPQPPANPADTDPLVPAIVLGDEAFLHARPVGLEGEAPGRFSENPALFGADFSKDDRASFHPHGDELCASGCAASRHPTPELSPEKFRELMARFALDPLDESSEALESLLFHGRQTDAFLRQLGPAPLDDARADFLRCELRRDHAWWSFRVIDEHGIVRSEMKRTRVPLDRRHVFDMEHEDLPPLITSGTVKRVGLHHLWTRI